MTHKGTRTIDTKHLILRQFRIEDAQAMYDRWASDPQVTRFLTWPPHESVDYDPTGDWQLDGGI